MPDSIDKEGTEQNAETEPTEVKTEKPEAPAEAKPDSNQQLTELKSEIQQLRASLKSLSSEFQAKSEEAGEAVRKQIKELTIHQLGLPKELLPAANAMPIEQLKEWVSSEDYKVLAEKLQRASEPPKPAHSERPVGGSPPEGNKPVEPPKATTFAEVPDSVYQEIGALFS